MKKTPLVLLLLGMALLGMGAVLTVFGGVARCQKARVKDF